MPIRIRLDYLMLDRAITLTELAPRVGLTLANLSILKANPCVLKPESTARSRATPGVA